MDFNGIVYAGEITTVGGTFRYRRAEPEDAPRLARMYRECAIDRSNIKARLTPGGADAFDRKGGMYVIMNEEEIRKRISERDSLWAVIEETGIQNGAGARGFGSASGAETYGGASEAGGCGVSGVGVCGSAADTGAGRLAGSFWISMENEELPDKLRRAGTVCPREIIVRREYAGRHVGRLLYHTVFHALLKSGYQKSVCEVYRTVGYEADGVKYPSDMLNRPSYIDMLLLGGKYEGASPVKEIHLKGLTVWVEPYIFSFIHEKALSLTEEMMDRYGIRIREYEPDRR